MNQRDLEPTRSAVVICDVWDRHWCRTAERRTAALAEKIDAFVRRLRAQGSFIVHAPSDTMDFYKNVPARRRMAEVRPTELPPRADIAEWPFPIDSSDGGCPDEPRCHEPDGPPWPWSRQHEAIKVFGEDGVSDDGKEIYSAITQRGINRLAFTGVHANLCLLDRSFGIRQMRG